MNTCGGGRMAIVLGVLLAIVLGFYWYTVSDWREMVEQVRSLKADVALMKKHIDESERVLTAVRSLEVEVRSAREEMDERLSDADDLSGDALYEYLERLLYEDAIRRHGADSSGEPDGALSGTTSP